LDSRLLTCNDGRGSGNQSWETLYGMLGKLGVGGTSSDESDGEDPKVVRVKEWRSTEVKDLLVFIDANRKTLGELGSSLPGNKPHERVRGRYAPSSSQPAIVGLPINFYSAIWYAGLTEIEKTQLGALPAVQLPNLDD
jgi:hypothetical protein